MISDKTSRRDFLKLSAAGVAALTIMPYAKACETASADPHSELNEMTIADLQKQMATGSLSSQALVAKYLERIREIDPKLNSVIEINPDALAIAARLDKEYKAGKIRGPLHGIPVLIKDNIDTRDRMHTTAGSLALLDAPTPEKDAYLVRNLRRAGAVIIGKTNMSEWANFRSTKSSSGWSARGGQTNNPYVLSQNPCGSSSGTGAAVSANLAVVGVGTETNGSIICPSVKCGLVGIKPTLGLISRSGIIPIAHSQDTAGPMTRTVRDAAILLGVMVGYDRSDPITLQSTKGHRDYTQFLDKDGLQGARIGITRKFFGKNKAINALMESHLQILKDSGATLVDVTFLTPENFWEDEHRVLTTEFKTDINKYLAARNSRHKTLADLIQFNEDNAEREMPLFGQELFLQSQDQGDLTDEEYLQALRRLKVSTQEQGIDAVMEQYELDAIVSLPSGATWGLSAIAGYPYITVPAGLLNSLPTGLAFLGRAFSEPKLLKIAYAFEQKTLLRQTPKLLPSFVQNRAKED